MLLGILDRGVAGEPEPLECAVSYGHIRPKCIPDNMNNRECVLVLGGFDANVIVARTGGVFANNTNALGRQHPPTEGTLINHAWP